jgi:alkyl hydroperoxide reductase subunit AhpF
MRAAGGDRRHADKITLRTDGGHPHPVLPAAPPGTEQSLRFAAIPLGHEFTSLVLALLWTGGHPPKVERRSSRSRRWTATSTSRPT